MFHPALKGHPMPKQALTLLALAAALAGCALEQPPTRAVGSTPIGTSATGGATLTSQGAMDINREYYTGADPNFPRGMGAGSRGRR